MVLSWKRGFLSAEIFGPDQHLMALLDRPLLGGGWELTRGDAKYLIRRPHMFAREYQVTRERSGEVVATVFLPLFPLRRTARITLVSEQQTYTFRYTNFWRRHFQLSDPAGQVCMRSESASLFGWTGTIRVEDGTPELVALLAYFAYLRLAIRRRAARS